VYSFISTTGIIVEAIEQLHRVFFKTNKVPFHGERKYFATSPSTQDDNRYFAQLRATFGAHPVRLDDDNGRWFASWPYDHYLEQYFDIQVRLYSRDVGKNDITFGLAFSELKRFLESRYSYLEILIVEIEKQFSEFCSNYSKIAMLPAIKAADDVRQLRKESTVRLDSEYYNATLDEIVLLLDASTNDPELQTEEVLYKQELMELAEEIRLNLLTMTFGNLEQEKSLDLPYSYDKLGYAIEKLYTFDFDSSREPLFNAHIRALNDYCNGKYHFSRDDGPDALRLKLKLMLAWKRNDV
jgi:hypothetical protein